MMALSKKDASTLQEIVDLDGNCLNSSRCSKCPFRAMCLPEFLNPVPPTTQQRAKMALDVLTHHALVDEDLSTEELTQDFTWDKK
jgi:hypothetical protein